MTERDRRKAQRATEDYRQWIANGTPEQKALWAREREIHNKPELRAEYHKIVASLQTFLPPSKMESGGKYGYSEHHCHKDGVLEGLKCHLRRNF